MWRFELRVRAHGRAALLFAGLAVAPAIAAAQQIDLSHGGPITVTAMDSIDLDQNAQTVTARGNARAVRDNVTVTADRLIAYYRKKTSTPGTVVAGNTTPASAAAKAAPTDTEMGNNEIYRLVAEGNVHIYTQTDIAQSDRAVYDIDQAVLVLTGHDLKLTTPNDVLTARDSMEYWSQKHMAVGRGDANVTTNDGRRIDADVLVAYTTDNNQPGAQGAKPQPKPAASTNAQNDPLASSGKLKEAQAFGHVVIRTATEIVHGDRGVYDPATGIAVVVGNVHITRGENELNGNEAIVDLKTGISHLVSDPGQRVQGLVVPNSTQQQQQQDGSADKAKPAPAGVAR